MESNIANEPNIILKQWDIVSASIGKHMPANWGISKENISLALGILKENKIEIIDNDNISFKAFRFICRFLYNNKIAPEDINSALSEYAESLKKINIQEKFILEIQQTIQSLFSPLTPLPYPIKADGIWGQESIAMLEYLKGMYALSNTAVDEVLLKILQSVSQRILRIACYEDKLIERYEYNPFAIIDNKGEEFELIPKGNGAAIVDKKTNNDLAVFHSFYASDRNGLPAFNQFLAWLLLLKMSSMRLKNVAKLLIRKKNDQWTNVEQLPAVNKDVFFIKPDYYISFPDFKASISLHISLLSEEPIDIIGIYFSGDFKFTISHGHDINVSADNDDKARLFDPENLFSSYSYLQDQNSVAYPLYKADFFKVFVVKKDFWESITNNVDRTKIPGVDEPYEFYKLITADENDIYAEYTIGLSFDENVEDRKIPFSFSDPIQDKTVLFPFNNKWILVAGSATGKLSIQEELMSEAIGRICAEKGFGLICGGYSGVDGAVLSSFKTALQEYKISLEGRVIQLRTDTDKFVPANSKQGATAAFYSSLFRDDSGGVEGVVLIGGRTGTDRINKQAQTRRKPVIPIPATGGIAHSIFNDMQKSKDKLVSNDLLESIDQPIESASAAVQIAKTVISWIDDLNEGVQEKFFSKEELFPDKENKPTSLLPFKNKWVLVVGTGSGELSKEEKLMVEAICGQCAEKGYGIMCGGWPGVDELVATTFTAYMSKDNIQDKERLIQVLGQTNKANSDYGKVEWVLDDSEWYSKTLDKAMAVVLIGGLGGTYDAFKEADRRSIPVIPVPATAGDAREAYHALFSKDELPYSRDLFTNLDMELDTAEEANQVANNIIDILDEIVNDEINIFISYAREDGQMLVELLKHLNPLIRDNKVNIWYDELMLGGENWADIVSKRLSKSQVILFLISVDFLNSGVRNETEVKIALEKHDKDKAVIIPVILRACDWGDTPYAKFQALPNKAEPISSFKDKDKAYMEVSLGIKKIIDSERNQGKEEKAL